MVYSLYHCLMEVHAMNCPLQARRCGGCTRLSVPYEKQLAFKQKKVESLFPGIPVQPIIGMDEPFHYRNKVISAFAHNQSGLISGMYAYGTHYVLPTDDCLLENRHAGRIIRVLRGLLSDARIKAYDEDRKTGLIRFVQVRYAERTKQALVTIVTSQPVFDAGQEIARQLMKRCPDVRTVVQNINPRSTSAVLGFQERILAGPGFIEDLFLDKKVRLSSRAFYQINTVQAEKLYLKALSLSRMKQDDLVLDAYCGIGLIGLLAADQVQEVTGVEINAAAVRDAETIARLNDAGQISFHTGDAAAFMKKNSGYSLVFLDPPRCGLDKNAIDALIRLAPERICYISCNPETQARDYRFLSAAGYRADILQPVDMFPHTDHIESIMILTRAGL